MKIDDLQQSTMVYDIANFLREKINLTAEQSGLLRFCLEDNILMNIKIGGVKYQTSWRYWEAFINAYSSCCGTCNDDTLFEVDRARKELIKNSSVLSESADNY